MPITNVKGGGITKLSELIIDANKDWGAFLIKNLGVAVDDADALEKVQAILEALLTTQGDILYRGASKAERLGGNYGLGYNFLHCTNTGQFLPEWKDIEDLIIYISGAVNRAVALPSLAIPVPVLSLLAAEDHSGGGHPVVPDTLSIPLPIISVPTAAPTSVNAVGGAVAHNDDVGDSDETIPANEATANDMTLLPAGGAANDHYALGYANKYDAVVVNVGTVGADITLAFEYSKGAGVWGTLTTIVNEINSWKTAGKVWLTFVRPGDWAIDTLAGIVDLYWIRFRATVIGGAYVQPKGNQAWILTY